MSTRDKKRVLERENISNKRHCPSLARVVIEAMKEARLLKLCNSLEPLLRRVIAEEIQRALANSSLLHSIVMQPAEEDEEEEEEYDADDSCNVRLQWRKKVALPVFTGSRLQAERGEQLEVVVENARNGEVISRGTEASVTVELVVLNGDFCKEDDEDWEEEEFRGHEVLPRSGKGALLLGEVQFTLTNGVGHVGQLSFSDNSSWIRSRKFRIGVRVCTGTSSCRRIREAKSEAFVVKDHRGELYKKHYPPELSDEVWRLDKIGKGGVFHRKLSRAGIKSVEDLLRLVVVDQHMLRTILGSGMSNRMWAGTLEHAKSCVMSRKAYVYYANEECRSIGIIFNTIFEVMGIVCGTRYLPVHSLSHCEKVNVDKVVRVAYANIGCLMEYNGDALIDFEHQHTPLESSILPSTAVELGATSCVEDEMMRAKGLEFLENEEMQMQVLMMLGFDKSSINNIIDNNMNSDNSNSSNSSNNSNNSSNNSSSSSSSSRKVNVGWLKIRAVLRWGICIRNKAAARRMERIS